MYDQSALFNTSASARTILEHARTSLVVLPILSIPSLLPLPLQLLLLLLLVLQVHPPYTGIRKLAVVSLADTSTLWQYGGPDSSTTSPLVSAKLLQLKGQPPSAQLLLVQPAGGATLAAGGTSPRGFWSGHVSHGGV
jgi:hypothetical protein